MGFKNQRKCSAFLFIYTAAPKPVKLLDVHSRIDKCDLILKWEETQNNGAAITKYTVYQRTVTGNGTVPSEWKNIHSSLVYTYHVFNLERGKCYEFKVTATNKNGQGMEENIVRVKVKEGKFILRQPQSLCSVVKYTYVNVRGRFIYM